MLVLFFGLIVIMLITIPSVGSPSSSLSHSLAKSSLPTVPLCDHTSRDRGQIWIGHRQLASCVMTTDGGPVRKLLQINGTVEDTVTFSACSTPSSSGLTQQFDFTYSSSSREVLIGPSKFDNFSSPVDFSILQAVPCTNVSVFLTFDALVGITIFSMIAIDPASRDQLCAASIEYVIVGVSVYEAVSLFNLGRTHLGTFELMQNRGYSVRQRTPIMSDASDDTAYILHSGVENSMVLDYLDAVLPATREFLFRAQFPDGSDSSTKPSSFVSQILQSLIPKVDSDATSPVRFDEASCAIVRPALSEIFSSESPCGIAIAVSQGSAPTLGVRFEPYKDGTSAFFFSWPSLTAGDQILEGGVFETVVIFQVTGNPPPIVESIVLPKTLFRAGGQSITLRFDNSEGSRSRVLRVGDFNFLEIPGSYRRLENGLFESTFESVAGNGTDIPYTIEVSYDTGNIAFSRVDESVQARISYVTVPLNIGSINPPWGHDREEIILQGFFDMFDPFRSDHHLYIGEKSVMELGISPVIDYELGTITLRMPSREGIGSAYVYPLRVVINREETNVMTFSYIPDVLIATIDMLGGSQDIGTDEYLVGICDYTQYKLRLPSGSAEPDSILWTLERNTENVSAAVEANLFDIFPDITTRNKSVIIPPIVFSEMIGSFVIQVQCEVYGRLLNTSVVIRTTGVPVIGVDLPPIPTRSIGLPNLPTRINAIVTTPVGDCYSSASSIIYKWTFDSITRNFSSDNPPSVTNEDDVRPGRLGRELVIPQSRLRYGVFPIHLSVYLKDNPLISGNASTTLIVKQAEPVAVIGSGALQIYHGIGSDLLMRADGSYAPDSVFEPDAAIVWYSWSCELFLTVKNSNLSTTCPGTFLPAASVSYFSISSSILIQTKERLLSRDEVSPLRIVYSLRVGTSITESPVTTQTIDILPTMEKVPSIFQVDLLTGRGTTVNWKRVRFYDELVIHPKAVGITWTFSVLAPASDARLFALPVSLLQYDGYYDAMENSSQPHPLGVKAHALRPAQIYQIAITSYGDNETGVTGLTVVQFETVDRPRLVLPSLVLSEGNISTVYSASAEVNLDSDSQFFFFFFLVGEDGAEICIDGCSGRSTVQFRVLETGNFRLMAKLRDVEGTSILDEQFFTSNITVLPSSSEASALSPNSSALIGTLVPWLRDAYRFGDHGAVEQISSALARLLQDLKGDDQPGNVTAILTLSLSLMYNVVLNSVPNALTAQSYIKTLNQFARLDPYLLPDVDSLLILVGAVDETLSRVPITEALDVLQDLLMFYNLTTRHALEPFSGAYLSSRIALTRLVHINPLLGSATNMSAHSFNSVTLDKRVFLVDFFTMLQKHLSLVLSRDAVCGATQTVNTSISGGVGLATAIGGNTTASTGDRNSSGFISSFKQYETPVWSTFSIAVICNPSEANQIIGHKSWFSWCDEFTLTEEEGFYSTFEVSPSPEFPSSSFEPAAAQLPFTQEIRTRWHTTDVAPSHDYTAVNLSKRLYTLMETMDYAWLSGLVGDDLKTTATYLLTANALSLSGNEFFRLSSPSKSCYNLNTSVPKLGRTEGGGCLGVKGFTVDVETDADNEQITKRPWRMTRSFDNIVAKLSVDGSSSLMLHPKEAQIVGAVLDSCPVDLQNPEVELPEKIDQFSYIIIGTAVGASTIVTLTWIGTSAQYATFTGATVVAL